MVTVLGMSVLAVGMIEGIAEATASITKVFSGALSDWLGQRKFLTALAYALSAYPVGVLSDRMNRVTALIVGLLLLVAADLVLALPPASPGLPSASCCGACTWASPRACCRR